jgi:hypothetical protein
MTVEERPLGADVAPETEKHWESRQRFRSELLDELDARLREAELEIVGGDLDGVRVVTHKAWTEACNGLYMMPLPAVDDRAAEVVTDSVVTVWAVCPRCLIAGPIRMSIEPELRVDSAHAELRLRAKAKPRTHVCGQLTIPASAPVDVPGLGLAWDVTDIAGEQP